eukprot:tig00020562_g11172.t1
MDLDWDVELDLAELEWEPIAPPALWDNGAPAAPAAPSEPTLNAPPEFELLRRQTAGVSQTLSTAFQPFAPLPETLWSLQRDRSGRPYVHYPFVMKLRKYKLKTTDAGSRWIGRQLVVELAFWDTGEVFDTHDCSAPQAPGSMGAIAGPKKGKPTFPFVDAPRVFTGVDSLGETCAFALDACRCLKPFSFELRISDAETGQRPACRLKLELVRSGAPQPKGSETAPPRSVSTATLPPLSRHLAGKHAAGDGPLDPPQAFKRPRAGEVVPSFDDAPTFPTFAPGIPSHPAPLPPPPAAANPFQAPAISHQPLFPNPLPLPPHALVSSPQSDPSPTTSQVSSTQDSTPPMDISPTLPSAPPQSPASSLSVVSPPGSSSHPFSPPPPTSPPVPTFQPRPRREEAVLQEAGYLDSLLSSFARSAPAPDRSSVAEILSSAERKFWDVFVSAETRQFSFKQEKEEDEEGAAGAGAGGPMPDADPRLAPNRRAPAPRPAPVPPPVPFSPSPYILDPSEEDEFMRRVNAAEAAGAAAALGVLLGDPRILGTPLFRKPAGWIRTRHLYVLVRTLSRSSGPGRPRHLFPPPSFDAILRSLTFNLLAGPVAYPTLEESERACENIWNYVTVVTSEYILVSPDFMFVPFEEVLRLHERAMDLAAIAMGRFGREYRTEMLVTTAKVRAAFSLRMWGHLRSSLELVFEAWDDLLRLRVYPHRLECEVLRELCELHVQIERTDLARHFAERLYWFEETDGDIEFKVSCLQTLAYIEWHEGSPDVAADGYRKAVETGRELVERSGGNPFYVVRMGRAMKSMGLCEFAAGAPRP